MAPGVRTAARGASTPPEVLITCSEQETDLRYAELRVQSVLFPGVDAEQGEPYGPVVEQLSLEKEQLGAPAIWANYKTLDLPCVSQQSSGSVIEVPCVRSPGQPRHHPSLDAPGCPLSLSELVSEVTCSKCPSSLTPQPLPSGEAFCFL